MRINSMPKLREAKGGNKTKIYCHGTICRKCVLAALRTVKLGLTKVGYQAKALEYSEKNCISYQFRGDIQTYGHRLRDSRQRRSRNWQVRSKMPGCCCLNDTGNTILFRINISMQHKTIAELEGTGQWLGLAVHRTSRQWTSSYGGTLKPWFTRRQLILKRILLPVLLRQQQPGIFGGTRFCLLCRWPYIWISAQNWCEIQLFFFRIIRWFCLISNLSPIRQSVAMQGHISDYCSLNAMVEQLKNCHLLLVSSSTLVSVQCASDCDSDELSRVQVILALFEATVE